MIRLAGPAESVPNLELVTLATLKTTGDFPASADDAVLQLILDAIHVGVFRQLGGRFVKSTGTAYDEVYDGTDRFELFLDQRPIVSVASIEEGQLVGNGQFQVWRPLATTDYQIDAAAGAIRRVLWGNWPGGASTRIVYQAGYVTIPPDLRLAVVEWATVKYRRLAESRLDKLSTATDAESEQYTRDDAPAGVLAVLERYRLSHAFVG